MTSLRRFQFSSYQLTSLLILLLLVIGANAQNIFHVSPNGDDSWNGEHASYQGGIGGPWRTLNQANISLIAGHIVEIQAGTYEGQIRPQNSGSNDSLRIVYRPAGDGAVVLLNCVYGGSNKEEVGAIALGRRNYITVTGKSNEGAVDERLLQIKASGFCDQYGNAAGSEGCIIENIIMEFTGETYAPNRGFVFSDYWWEGDYETQFCILRNCIIEGYIRDPEDPTRYTEDVISVAKNAHHLLIENNVIGISQHVSLNFNEASVYRMVIRNNEIINTEHTALSFYGLGAFPGLQSTHLVEGNTLIASGENESFSINPGNALQFGASETIIRHNIIAEGGNINNSPASVGGLSASVGGFPPPIYRMIDNRFYNNTIANNFGVAVGSFSFGGDIADKGRNKWVNNVLYGSTGNLLLSYWPDFDDGQDRWISNVFGNPNGIENEDIMNIGWGSVNLDEAISTYSNPTDPDFSNWNDFTNRYEAILGFLNYGEDYNLLPNGPCQDTGAPLTQIHSSDEGNGNILMVDDSRFFFGEANEFPSWMGVQPDWIAIGPNLEEAVKVAIVEINDAINQIVITENVQRQTGDFVWLWRNSQGIDVIKGDAPDIGASEHGLGANSSMSVKEETFRIFPNPSSGIFNLKTAGNIESFHLRIMTSQGQVVHIQEIKPSLEESVLLNLSFLPAGIYFMEVQTSHVKRSLKIYVLK